MPAIEKAFVSIGDGIVERSTGNEQNKIGSHDKKWREESKAKLLKQFKNEKRANLVLL